MSVRARAVTVAIATLQRHARLLKREVYTLYLAYKDPRVPWYARLFAACVVAYALSPLDLIPDAIPVLGHLDDLIIVPLGVALAIKLVPSSVLTESRRQAEVMISTGKPVSWLGAAIVLVGWLLVTALVIALLVGGYQRLI